jgi:hypothetical protein
MFQYSIWFILCLLVFNCSTFSTYLENRALDTADIFTLSVERKIAGVNIKYCISNLGLQSAKYGKGYGLRAGSIGAYSTGAAREYYNSGNSFILLNSVHHHPSRTNVRNNISKSFNESNTFGLGIFDWNGYNSFTQCEFSIGLYYGLRVGFNLAEMGDWLLGWFTIDFLNDDNP